MTFRVGSPLADGGWASFLDSLPILPIRDALNSLVIKSQRPYYLKQEEGRARCAPDLFECIGRSRRGASAMSPGSIAEPETGLAAFALCLRFLTMFDRLERMNGLALLAFSSVLAERRVSKLLFPRVGRSSSPTPGTNLGLANLY